MKKCLMALLLMAFHGSALSALITTVEWKQQYAQIGPSDHVEIWVTLTVDSASDPLYVNKNDPAPYFGTDPAMLPTHGLNYETQNYEPFASYTDVSIGAFWVPCGTSSTFVAFCGGDYDYSSTNYGVGFQGHDYLGYYSPELVVNPGESIDFYVTAFEAPEGGASIGEHMMLGAGVSLRWSGLDVEGNDIVGWYDLGDTCPARDASCALVRTVVPIPAAFWLFGSALLGLGLRSRKV